MAIQRNHTRPLVEEITFEWSKESGHTNTQRIRGPKASIRALYPGIVSRASRVILRETSSKPWSEIEATYGGQDDSGETPPTQDAETVVWELLASDDQKPITDSAAFKQLIPSDQNKVLQAIQQKRNGELDSYPAFSDLEACLALLNVGVYVDGFLDDSWVLRKTQVIDNPKQLGIAMTGISSLWTTAQVRAAETTIYEGIQAAMVASPEPQPVQGYIWGWLKRRPSVTGRANNKIEITQDWIQAQWANILYPVYVP